MNPDHLRVLDALYELTLPQGEMCVCFAPLARRCKIDRARVRRVTRFLARKGFAEYHRGLVREDDGTFAGSGYCITHAGVKVIESLPPLSWPLPE